MDDSHRDTLLLLLMGTTLLSITGPQPALTQSTDPDYDATLEPENSSNGGGLQILGPDYVTVGVPSSISCEASCAASCTYSMALDGQKATGQGNVIAFLIEQWVQAISVTCTVTDDDNNTTLTTTKWLQVLYGPANISITGSDLMKPTASHTYSCHAYCRPSCSYAWQINKGPWISGQGNVISITPQELDMSKTLNCRAANTVSGMFIAASRTINVTYGPTQVTINGPGGIEIGKMQAYTCTAVCLPSCRYLWTVDRQTLRGSTIEITVEHPADSVMVKCEAQNTASRKTDTAVKTVWIEGRNLSTRPAEAKTLLLPFAAFIVSTAVVM